MKGLSNMNERDPIEGEYQPPQPQEQQEKRSRWGSLGTAAAAALVAASKLKFLAFGLKFLASSWTFLLSLALYAAAFGWKLGVVIILALAAHELGHFFAYRAYGLHARLPVFVPFFGAFTAGAIAPDLEHDAYIALAGPLTGLAIAASCYGFGVMTSDRFWYACADLCAFLNLFNMIPVVPFDGGRVIGAIWAPLWVIGAVILVVAAAYLHVPIFLVVIIALLGAPAIVATLRGHVDPRAAAMTNGARFRVGIWYLITTLGLVIVLGHAHAQLPASGGL